MERKLWAISILILFLSVGFTGCLDDDKVEDKDDLYRQRMRDLVIAIGEHARQVDADFILIPQNGHELLSLEKDIIGTAAMDYIDAIDGMGQEDLLYGYGDDDRETPTVETKWLQDLLDLGEANGVEALVTDYCWTHSKMDDSYEKNEEKGYISFVATHRGLDNIPDYPGEPYNVNDNDVATLSDARNFLYLLDPSTYNTRRNYLDALRNTNYDVLIIDAFYDDIEILSREEVDTLKVKKNGGKRLVISYMSIGEVEEYRYYWKDGWKVGDPEFIGKENPEWEGNYKVRYWDANWKKVIFGEADSYTDRLLASGFDGVYLDIIEAFEYYE